MQATTAKEKIGAFVQRVDDKVPSRRYLIKRVNVKQSRVLISGYSINEWVDVKKLTLVKKR